MRKEDHQNSKKINDLINEPVGRSTFSETVRSISQQFSRVESLENTLQKINIHVVSIIIIMWELHGILLRRERLPAKPVPVEVRTYGKTQPLNK